MHGSSSMQYGILQTNILGTSPPRCSSSTRQHFHRLPFEGEPCRVTSPWNTGHVSWYRSTRTDRPQLSRTDTRPTQGHRPRVPGGMSTGSSAPLPRSPHQQQSQGAKRQTRVALGELLPKHGCDGAVRGEAPASATCSRWFLSG